MNSKNLPECSKVSRQVSAETSAIGAAARLRQLRRCQRQHKEHQAPDCHQLRNEKSPLLFL